MDMAWQAVFQVAVIVIVGRVLELAFTHWRSERKATKLFGPDTNEHRVVAALLRDGWSDDDLNEVAAHLKREA